MAALLLIISFGVFSLTYIAPGSAEQMLLGAQTSDSPESLAALRAEYHLDKPFLQQYAVWLEHACASTSAVAAHRAARPTRYPEHSLRSTLVPRAVVFAIATLAGVPLGVLAAVRKRRALDRAIVGVSVVGVSAPAVRERRSCCSTCSRCSSAGSRSFGSGSGFFDRLWHLALPALALALTAMALVVKLTRAAMIDALDQDYVTFARARGIATAGCSRRTRCATRSSRSSRPAASCSAPCSRGAVLVEITFRAARHRARC